MSGRSVDDVATFFFSIIVTGERFSPVTTVRLYTSLSLSLSYLIVSFDFTVSQLCRYRSVYFGTES